MLKIVVTVKEKINSKDDCTVKLEMSKDKETATISEKSVGAEIYNVISKSLADLQENKNIQET